MSITELGQEFVALKKQYEEKEKELKEIGAKWEQVEKDLLEEMALVGVDSFSLEGLGKLYFRNQNYYTVAGDHKQAFFEYLKECGNEHLLKLDVHPNTLKSFLNEHEQLLIADNVAKGMDEMEAKSEALEFLKSKGASFFTKRGLSFRKG